MSARVIVTGAASGIGAAATAELRSRGARVVGLDLDDAGADMIACDVRDQASVDRAVGEAVERLGGLDVLINNAGIGSTQSAGAPPDEGALATIDVNTLGAWRLTSAALAALRESHGRVVTSRLGHNRACPDDGSQRQVRPLDRRARVRRAAARRRLVGAPTGSQRLWPA